MSRPDDYSGEMIDQPLLTDSDVDALLQGLTPARPDLDALADVISGLTLMAEQAPPPARPALAAVLAGGPILLAGEPGRPGRRILRLAGRVGAMSLTAKLVMASGAAAAGLTGAAAAGALPGPVQDAVAGVVSAVTPFDLPRRDDAIPAPDTPPGSPGDRDSARGRSAGTDPEPEPPSGSETDPASGPLAGEPGGSGTADPSGPAGGPVEAPGGTGPGTAPSGMPATDAGPPTTSVPSPTGAPGAPAGQVGPPEADPEAPADAGTGRSTPPTTAPAPAAPGGDAGGSGPGPSGETPDDLAPDLSIARAPVPGRN